MQNIKIRPMIKNVTTFRTRNFLQGCRIFVLKTLQISCDFNISAAPWICCRSSQCINDIFVPFSIILPVVWVKDIFQTYLNVLFHQFIHLRLELGKNLKVWCLSRIVSAVDSNSEVSANHTSTYVKKYTSFPELIN